MPSIMSCARVFCVPAMMFMFGPLSAMRDFDFTEALAGTKLHYWSGACSTTLWSILCGWRLRVPTQRGGLAWPGRRSLKCMACHVQESQEATCGAQASGVGLLRFAHRMEDAEQKL